MSSELWVCGQNRPDLPHRWELCGIFTTEEKAVARCLDASYWIAPLPLDVDAPEAPTPIPRSRFPLAP